MVGCTALLVVWTVSLFGCLCFVVLFVCYQHIINYRQTGTSRFADELDMIF